MNSIFESGVNTTTALTVEIVCAHVSKNTVGVSDLPELIRGVYGVLHSLDCPPALPTPSTYEPAVSIKKSLASQDHIISMIDGKPYKMLKRHLTTNGLTADEYRARYGLPASYPMTAPDYALKRRELALKIGLGKKVA